jgi:hypothetical protein
MEGFAKLLDLARFKQELVRPGVRLMAISWCNILVKSYASDSSLAGRYSHSSSRSYVGMNRELGAERTAPEGAGQIGGNKVQRITSKE